ncbi:MAG: NUDIX domain-containing protein [Patescibacteria group bacterium]
MYIPERPEKQVVYKAGGIVIQKNKIPKVALLYRAKQQDWTFPKGHIEAGETPARAAKREVEEETGLIVEIFAKLIPLEYLHNDSRTILTHMYLMRPVNRSKFKAEHKRDQLKWVPINEVVAILKYDNLKRYFMIVQPMIERLVISDDLSAEHI